MKFVSVLIACLAYTANLTLAEEAKECEGGSIVSAGTAVPTVYVVVYQYLLPIGRPAGDSRRVK
jgi:hypothetical protein